MNATRRHLLTGAALGAAALLLPRTAAADTVAEVKKRGRVIIGIQGDNPPFGFVNSQGVQDGYDADVGRLLPPISACRRSSCRWPWPTASRR